jgi:hypothetical protein
MSSVIEQKRREAKRQEVLLMEAMGIAKKLAEPCRLRLYDYLGRLIETGDAETPPTPETDAPSTEQKAGKRHATNGEGSYTDRTEALILGLGPKNGMTTREVSDTTGQKRGSADGTLRYISNRRKTIEKRKDGKWYAVASGKRPQSGPKMGVREEIVAAFEGNGNAPLATRDIAIALPDVKRGTLDKTLVGMRADGILISCGSDPKGVGGLYKLAKDGGARATAN